MGATPSEKGVWLPTIGITAPIFSKIDEVPWQPWSRAIFLEREKHELEPHTRCKASGVARQFETPYGVEFLEMTDEQRLYIFDIGGPHTFRTVYMDGRSHPTDLMPSYYGHSVGWWEGDTLVIDTVGYNERFWMDRRGVPHTDKLHTIERFTRNDSQRHPLRVHRRRSRRLHRAVEGHLQPALGSGHRSSSSTCASRPTTPTS